jgi:hypothetical protein
MPFQVGDIVRIIENEFDEPVTSVEPLGIFFKGQLGEVKAVRMRLGVIYDYEINLLDQAFHTYVSGGDGDFNWPFFEDELELVLSANPA